MQDVARPIEDRIFEAAERVGEAVRDVVFKRTMKLRGTGTFAYDLGNLFNVASLPTQARFARYDVGLEAEHILRIITAPGLPLIGHEAIPAIDLLGVNGEEWKAYRDGSVIRADEEGETVTLQARAMHGIGHPIDGEDVWRVMAELFAAYDLVQASLRKGSRGPKAQRDAIKQLAPALRVVARTMDKAFPMQSDDVTALSELAKELSPDVDAMARYLDREVVGRPKALKTMVGALDEAFMHLYGKRAGGHADPESSPANRFAFAFLRELGHKYEYGTIADARINRRVSPSTSKRGA